MVRGVFCNHMDDDLVLELFDTSVFDCCSLFFIHGIQSNYIEMIQ
jgi:hypothetical protein